MQSQISTAEAACANVLRPLVRLGLNMGVKYAQFDRLLRTLFIEEARRLLQSRDVPQPNISQISTTTGLNRKDVTSRVRQDDTQPAPLVSLSVSMQVFTRWQQLVVENTSNRFLRISAAPGELSFEGLARQASRGDVHHRAVLDDLILLGMARETDGQVELLAGGFVPLRDVQAMMGLLAGNCGDHVAAAVGNILQDPSPKLERMVYADGLTPTECERIHELARTRWATLQLELVREMTESVSRSGSDGSHRIRVGIYALHQEELRPGI